MRWWTEIGTRIRALLDRRSMERELDEEIGYHLDRETRKLVEAGWAPEEARREARRRFGGVERHREETRDAWGTRYLDDLARDVRLAFRRMAKAPGSSLLAVVTLALGLGGTVALFSVVHGLLMKPLPYPEADRLRTFWSEYNWRGQEFDHLAERVRAFEEIAAWSTVAPTLRADGGGEVLDVVVGSDELFDVLGVRPLLGTTFAEDADRPGAERVVVLSHDLWRGRFGADPGVVGRRITLDGSPATVIGVMPGDFRFPSGSTDAWMPLELDPADPAYEGTGWLNLVGRLRPGVDEAGEDEELARLTAALGERFEYPEAWDKTKGAWLKSLREYRTGAVRPALLLLMAAVGLMLAMAVVNVAALLLGKAADRRGETDLRTALGAARGRLARQTVTETGVLFLVGGGAGAALAVAGFDVLVAALPLGPGMAGSLRLEWPVLLGALGLAGALGVVASLAPVARQLSGAGTASLRPGARTGAGGSAPRGRLQGALVAAEVAVAVVLVTGAALFARSVSGLYGMDTGLRTEGVGAVDVVLEETVPPEEARTLLEALENELRALPGVTGVGRINRLPIRDGGWQGGVGIEGRADLQETLRPTAYWRPVTVHALDALGVEVVEGRAFDARDRAGSVEVGLVNRAFAREVWPGESPVGRRVGSAFGEGWVTVVGVVEDAAITGAIDARDGVPRVLYRPWDQIDRPLNGAALVFRSDDPAALLEPARAALAAVDARVAVGRTTTMERVMADAFRDSLRIRFFLGLLAALALVIGAAGVYGVVSYAVGRRRAEYGVRMALGAGRSRLVRGVLGRQLLPVAAGVVAGIAVAVVAARAASGLVHGVVPVDPPSLAAGAATLLCVGAVAALVPALRATRIDPAGTLREE